jgi:hypothetical protein
VETLIKATEGLPVFGLPVDGIDLGAWPWESKINIDMLALHVMRAMDSDLSYPIILDDCGYIADGWHRVLKAIITGRKKVKAIRLRVMPPPDFSVEYTDKENGEDD